MKVLLVLNDAPYGSERSYNGLRLALSLLKQEGVEVRVFLMSDGVLCALRGQVTPNGYYNVERMVGAIARGAGEVGCCGTCSDARGLTDETRAAGARPSSLEELTRWTLWSDKVLVF